MFEENSETTEEVMVVSVAICGIWLVNIVLLLDNLEIELGFIYALSELLHLHAAVLVFLPVHVRLVP